MAPKDNKQQSSKHTINKVSFANLNVVKQADTVNKLYIEGRDQKEISEMVGVSVPQVSNLITIAAMPKQLKKLVEEGVVTGTLVLQVRRDFKDFTDDDVLELIQSVYADKGSRMTRKDLLKHVSRHNSFAVVKKFMKRHNRNSVRKNEVVYETLNGIMSGKIDTVHLNKLFGIQA